MLRQDAEENSAPGHVVTLTSRDADVTAPRYRDACAVFWRAFRRRWGRVEFCGFIEWTTGRGTRSGGARRLHSHWLVKSLTLGAGEVVTRASGKAPCDCADASSCVECWAAAEWSKLTGAWIVQARELRSVGGVVGYLALHHEKMEQRPPDGWTGRRLRASKGYFGLDGRTRRQRARAWLIEHAWDREGLDDGAKLARSRRPAPRLVGAISEAQKASVGVPGQTLPQGPQDGSYGDMARWLDEVRREALRPVGSLLGAPGRSFASLPARVALEEQLGRPDAPIRWDWETRTVADAEYHRWRYAYRLRAEARERRLRAEAAVWARRVTLDS